MENNLKELEDLVKEGYEDQLINKGCKDWFPSYIGKQAYLLGRSKCLDRVQLTEDMIKEIVHKLTLVK